MSGHRMRLTIAGIVVASTLVLTGLASPAGFTRVGNVTSVVDGDTLDVRLKSGPVERVRLVGIDTPERGACFSAKATAAARALAEGKRVVLKGDPTQATRDRYGRLLAYVWLPHGRDLGYQLIAGGFGKVYIFRRAFERLSAYQRAEALGRRRPDSVWGCRRAPVRSSAARPTSRSDCDPSYPTVCIPPYDRVGDLDCADIPYSNFEVVGDDPHGFDGDGDGRGCESH